VIIRASARVRSACVPVTSDVASGGRSCARSTSDGRDDFADHPDRAEPLPSCGEKIARDPVVVQLLDLGRDDHAAAAAED
jgi:hypothetical protein